MRNLCWVIAGVALFTSDAWSQDFAPARGVGVGGANRESQSTGSPKPAGKRPVPADASQADALKVAKDVYSEQWAAAKTAEQKKAFAETLLQKGEESGDEPASQFELWKLAKEIAAQVGDISLAFEAIGKTAQAFQVSEVDLKREVLAGIAKKSGVVDHRAIVKHALGLMKLAVSNDEFSSLAELGEFATNEARRVSDVQLARHVRERLAEAQAAADAYQEVKTAASVLAEKPVDPAANLLLGKHLCLFRGDWDKGVPMLALGANEKLKAAAIKELAGPAAAADRTAIGDAWWDLAEKHQGLAAEQLQARAVYWYRQALPELTGLMKAKVDKRLGQYEAIEARATEKPAEPAEVIGKHPAKYQPGLVTELFNDPTFGKPVKVRIDSDIQCRWGFNPPDAAVTSTRFGVRWRGYVKPLKAGRYTFHADCRGNVRVLIDGALLINSQRSNLRGLNEGEVTLTATYHLIEVDFVQIFSPPECSLSWRPAGGNGNEPIAAASFFHDRQQAQAAGVGK